MKNIIMILAIAATLNASQSMCLFYLEEANKNVKLANKDRTGYMRDTYLQIAVNNYIRAQSSCHKSLRDKIQGNIDQIESVW